MSTGWRIILSIAGLALFVVLAAGATAILETPDAKGVMIMPAPAPTKSAAAVTPTAPPPTFDEAMADPNRKVAFIKKTLKTADGKEHVYQVWVPLDYTPKQRWPLILFLHGSGEEGTDGEKVLVQGVPKEIKHRKGQFEFIVVMPQSTGGWSGTNEDAAIKAVKTTCTEYAVDGDRIYLTGLSMGGFGAWDFARKYPKSFAACVPIASGGDTSPAGVMALRSMPLWVWHADDDGIVKVDTDRQMVTALVKANAVEVRYTELHGVGHASWDKAYASDEVWAWLLQHKVSDKGKQKPVKPVIDAPTWDGAAALMPAATPTAPPPKALATK